MIKHRQQYQPLMWHNQTVCTGKQVGSWAPIVDAVPDSVVFICDLFDPPGVVSRILHQKMIGQLVEGRNRSLASAQVLEERL